MAPIVASARTTPLKSDTVRGFSLTPEERADLVAFLQSLTDEPLVHDARFADPRPAAKGP